MGENAARSGFWRLVDWVGTLGDTPEDTVELRLQHRFLVYMGVLMSGGGLLWGSIALAGNLYLAAVIPYSYTVLTVFNLAYFRASKNFETVRFVQVMMSLLLPFFFQWSLGGFISSGAVMLWAMLALVGSLTFSESRSTIRWILIYAGFTIVSGLIDDQVSAYIGLETPRNITILFLVINIVIISSIVFGLTVFLLSQHERAKAELQAANARISELNEHLEDEVAARTRELRTSLARSRATLHNIPNGVAAIGQDGIIQGANPALGTILFLETDFVGQPAAEALPTQLNALALEAMDLGAVVEGDIPLRGERTGVVVASPIIETEGETHEVTGAVIILRDVTLEREIDRMKTDFIATVSHELRTPLTSVLGFAKISQNKLENVIKPLVPEDEKKAKRAYEQIYSNTHIIVTEAERLTHLISDVLDLSKMEAGRMEWHDDEIDPTELVHRCLDATRGLFLADEVSLESKIDAELPTVVGDKNRLLQVLINLVSNAAKFTEKGTVTVSLERVDDNLRFGVADTGDGIDAADLDAVFDKFRQVGDTLTDKPKGTGLGLPICRQIVAAHGGHIWAESDLGKGARFLFEIPVDRVARPTAVQMKGLAERIGAHLESGIIHPGKDILIVDDDENLRELLRQQIQDRGYPVRLAADGYQAIDMVRKELPGLVILDIMMPGISGFDVAAVLKSDPRTRGVPIIILSIVEDADRGYRMGVDSYLNKPHDPAVLLREIDRLLGPMDRDRRVLLVTHATGEAASDIESTLDGRGYDVVGRCLGEKCVEQAIALRPDTIIVDESEKDFQQLVEAFRKEPSLEEIHIVRLLPSGEEISAEVIGETTDREQSPNKEA